MDVLLYRLSFIICPVACLVSMVLTASFAVSFSSGLSDSQSSAILGMLLLGTIGVILDLCKYIFWGTNSTNHRIAFKSYATILLIFSWLASVAFFVTSEEKKVNHYRKDTAEYKSYIAKLESIGDKIQQKKGIAGKRLTSEYHDQWDSSQALTQEIALLLDTKTALISTEAVVGHQQAQLQIPSMALFVSIASIVNIKASTVRIVFYGVLALLIELCSIGLISYCAERNKINDPTAEYTPIESDDEETDSKEPDDNDDDDEENISKDDIVSEEERLRRDIMSGQLEPSYKKIHGHAAYRLSRRHIRDLLNNMKEEGFLEDGPRGSLKVIANIGLRVVDP